MIAGISHQFYDILEYKFSKIRYFRHFSADFNVASVVSRIMGEIFFWKLDTVSRSHFLKLRKFRPIPGHILEIDFYGLNARHI